MLPNTKGADADLGSVTHRSWLLSKAWPCHYKFVNDQYLHSVVKDLDNALTDLNIERDFNMKARCIHFNIIHFLGRNTTKEPCGSTGATSLGSPAKAECLWVHPFQNSYGKLSARFLLLICLWSGFSVGISLAWWWDLWRTPGGHKTRPWVQNAPQLLGEAGRPHFF